MRCIKKIYANWIKSKNYMNIAKLNSTDIEKQKNIGKSVQFIR